MILVRHQEARKISGPCLLVCSQKLVEVPGLETDLGADTIVFVVFRNYAGVLLHGLKKGTDVSVASLRGNLAGWHLKIATDNGVKA